MPVNSVDRVNSESDNKNISKDSVSKCSSHFLYLQIQFNCKVSALLDTGSSINLISYFLYNSLSKKYKSELLTVTNNKIILANNQEIQIDDIATITGIIEGNQTSFYVYVLKDTSHSLILGTEYLRSNGVIINLIRCL